MDTVISDADKAKAEARRKKRAELARKRRARVRFARQCREKGLREEQNYVEQSELVVSQENISVTTSQDVNLNNSSIDGSAMFVNLEPGN